MRFGFQGLAVALLALTALVSAVDIAVAADPIEPEPVEKMCLALVNPTGTVTPAMCDPFKTEKGLGKSVNGCPIGTFKVTSVGCAPQVTTFPDDDCNGTNGRCEPPTPSATSTKSISESATPNVKVGDCIGSIGDGSCKCETNGQFSTKFGRKKCG